VEITKTLQKEWKKQIDNIISDLSPEERALKTDINNAAFKWNKNIQDLLLLSKKDKDGLSRV
jgi:hypothetical protein